MRDHIDLIRDVLDNQLLDQDGVALGRADGLIAAYQEGSPLRLIAIESGGAVLARRLGLPRWGRVYRVDWARVQDVGIDVNLDVTEDAYAGLDLERRLRERVVARLPGGRR